MESRTNQPGEWEFSGVPPFFDFPRDVSTTTIAMARS